MALVRQLKTAGFRPISRYDIFIGLPAIKVLMFKLMKIVI